MAGGMDIALVGVGAILTGLVIILLFNARRTKRMKRRIARIKHTHTAKTEQELLKLSLRRIQPKKTGFGAMNLSVWLRYRMEISGLHASVKNYLLLNLTIMAFVTLAISLFLGQPILLGLLVGFILGVGLPHLYVGFFISRRKNTFLKLFPDAIDLIVRGLRAGLPVAKTMQSIVTEVPEPVSSVFREITDQVTLGITLEKAMLEVAKRLDMTEFNFFVTSITLQRETGGNLTEILSNLSEVLRQRHMMKLKIKAMSSEARASAGIIGSLPFILFIVVSVVSPTYMSPLFDDFRGNIALLGAFTSLTLGIGIMVKMARFEI